MKRLIGRRALIDGRKPPKEIKSDQAGEDSRCVWHHNVVVVQLQAVENPGGGGEEGRHSQREGQALDVTTAHYLHQVGQRRHVHADGDDAAG